MVWKFTFDYEDVHFDFTITLWWRCWWHGGANIWVLHRLRGVGNTCHMPNASCCSSILWGTIRLSDETILSYKDINILYLHQLQVSQVDIIFTIGKRAKIKATRYFFGKFNNCCLDLQKVQKENTIRPFYIVPWQIIIMYITYGKVFGGGGGGASELFDVLNISWKWKHFGAKGL